MKRQRLVFHAHSRIDGKFLEWKVHDDSGEERQDLFAVVSTHLHHLRRGAAQQRARRGSEKHSENILDVVQPLDTQMPDRDRARGRQQAVPADKISWRAAELSKAAHGGGVMHLGTAVGYANLTAQHAARSGTSSSKVLDDAPQPGLRILRDPELPGEGVPGSHPQSAHTNPLASGQLPRRVSLA